MGEIVVEIDYYEEELDEELEKEIIAWIEKRRKDIEEALKEIEKSKIPAELEAEFFVKSIRLFPYTIEYYVRVNIEGVFLVVREHTDDPSDPVSEAKIAEIYL